MKKLENDACFICGKEIAPHQAYCSRICSNKAIFRGKKKEN